LYSIVSTSAPAGAVEDRGDDGGVQIAVLLGQVAPEGEGDVDRPGGDADEVRPDQCHRALAGEAGPDAGLELRVARLELRRSHHDISDDPGPRIGVQGPSPLHPPRADPHSHCRC
jgi:hypothetical protein